MMEPFKFISCDRVKVVSLPRLAQVTFLLCTIFGTAQAAQWSETNPPINLTHIFVGEINARGKAVGFHARPFGRDPQDAHLQQIISGPNRLGIYTGEVEIYDEAEDRWRQKAFSSFFPDHLSRAQVTDLILRAYKSAKVNARGKWSGRSGAGFRIDGWLCPKGGTPTCPHGAINTAYPIYVKDK